MENGDKDGDSPKTKIEIETENKENDKDRQIMGLQLERDSTLNFGPSTLVHFIVNPLRIKVETERK